LFANPLNVIAVGLVGTTHGAPAPVPVPTWHGISIQRAQQRLSWKRHLPPITDARFFTNEVQAVADQLAIYL